MRIGTAFVVLSVPAICVAGVCTYWALTSSGWWLLGNLGAAIMLPRLD